MKTNREGCEIHYQKAAATYDQNRFYCKCRKYHNELSQETVYQFIKESEKTLDIGTGTGRFAIFFAEKGKNVIALDQSIEMLNEAKNKSIDANVGDLIEFIQGDVEKLPFKDNEFDAIVAIHVMTHFQDINNFVSEIIRVLKPGGTIVFDLSESINARLYQFVRNNIFRKPQTFPDYFRNKNYVVKVLNTFGAGLIAHKKIKKFPRFILHFLTCTLNFELFFNFQKKLENYNYGALSILKFKKL